MANKGWKNEPARHALAARGRRTARKSAPPHNYYGGGWKYRIKVSTIWKKAQNKDLMPDEFAHQLAKTLEEFQDRHPELKKDVRLNGIIRRLKKWKWWEREEIDASFSRMDEGPLTDLYDWADDERVWVERWSK